MKNIGLYIHIPFCLKKCNYCDFNSYETLELIPEYVKALKEEIKTLKGMGYVANTVYMGGGTPSVLKPHQLEEIFSTVYDSIHVYEDAEITIEANPGTLTAKKLKKLKELGVNRLSIGLQASKERLLKILGRIHTVKDFEKNFYTARDLGFDNISVDLIFGLPKQKVRDFEDTLGYILKLSPEHISCYSLSVEDGTKFYRLQQQGLLHLPSEKDERKMYHRAIEILTQSGYSHYEISNFALPGRESKHNIGYWTYKEYIGLGAGAHSFLNNKRFCNHFDISNYINSINKCKNASFHSEWVLKSDQLSEYCFLRLRLIKGLNKRDFFNKFGVEINQVYGRALKKLKDEGLLQEDGENIRLTPKGLDFANSVFIEFLP